MARNSDFESFLKDISPSKTTINEASRLHRSLRERLNVSKDYSGVCQNAYLSGSYAKHTFIRPQKESDCCDVDIVIETSRSTRDNPLDVLMELKSAISEFDVYRNVVIQNHSVGIDMASFHMDVVPLVRDEDGFLYIGSYSDGTWKQTNPKEHIAWSTRVNQEFDCNYKPLVKIMKWWRRQNCPKELRFPKGITLEKIIADNLPDKDLSIEDRVMQVMANLAVAYEDELSSYKVPFIEDPVLPGNNLACKYQLDDFTAFVSKLNEHLTLLAEKGTENETWKQILGSNFPSNSTSSNAVPQIKIMGQKKALRVQHRKSLIYPLQAPRPNATITATVTLPSGSSFELQNDGDPIPKESSIVYRINCGPAKDSIVKWQVTNTGNEAMATCPRGDFEKPNHGKTSRHETTAYTGKHYVQCFVIKRGVCVRWSSPFFINVE